MTEIWIDADDELWIGAPPTPEEEPPMEIPAGGLQDTKTGGFPEV